MEVKITKSDYMKKIIAFLLIVALTMFDFALIGVETVSYAVDALNAGTQTNNKNVTFDAYFKDASGKSVTNKEASIASSDLKLFAQVSVKNDGYFNGTITLGDSNFKIKNDTKNTAINKIEGNTIKLNQINSGETIELELGIEPIKEDTINLGFLNMSSKISIDGIYRNSEERDIKISTTRDVQLILSNPYADNEGIELTSNIITNKIYTINGENKRIVQLLVESNLKGNGYPVKDTNIEVSVPQGVQKVEVTSQGTFATNGKNEKEFNQSDYGYSEKDQKVNILIKNEAQDGKIKWNKNGKDSIVVTYTLDTDTNIVGNEITSKSKITLMDTKATTKELTKTVKVQEEKEGVINTGIELEENNMYKGKIYSGENRDYNVTTNIFVNESETGGIIKVDLSQSVYETANGEIPANAQYKKVIVNKSDVERILGQDGFLTILTEDGTQKNVISQETPTDENGNVIVEYPEGITALKVESSVVKQNGIIALKSNKTIREDGNSKDVKKTYTSLKEKVTGAEGKITLNETETKAELKLNKTKLSTLSKNENFEIIATLITDNEKYDLFKNPTFEITLPESINNLNVKTLQPIYADMFNIKEAVVLDGNNGTKIIRVALEGEQKEHLNTVNQTTLVISADIEFDLLTPSNKTAISMTYTNEKGFNDKYTERKDIEVESKYGLMMVTGMNGYNEAGDNIKTMDDEVAKGSLDLQSPARTAKVKGVVINNYDEAMQNVSIIGRIPTEGMNDGTVNTKLSNEIATTFDNSEILYSEDANAKVGDNTWKTSSKGAKAFKIKIGDFAKGAKGEIDYSFVIPENLEYGQNLYTKLDTYYTYLGNNMQQTSMVEAETPKLTGVSVATLKNSVENTDKGIKTNIAATSAGKELKDSDSVYEGQAIQYTVYVTNNTGRNLNNAKITVEQENGTLYGIKDVEVCDAPIYAEGEKTYFQHKYGELDTNKKEFGTVENFENGRTIVFTYESVTNEVNGNEKTQGNITIKADDYETVNANTISNKIEQAELKLNYKFRFNEEVQIYYGQPIKTNLFIENISDKSVKNSKITVRLPQWTYCEEKFCYVEYGYDVKILNEKYNKEDNTITFELSELESKEQVNVNIIVKSTEFEQDNREVVFIAEANTQEGKTYYSNAMARNIKNIAKNISLTQETNVNESTLLKNGDEITLKISTQNNTNTNLGAYLREELPNGFNVTDAYLEKSNETKKLDIIENNHNEEINIEKSSFILKDSLTGDSTITVKEDMSGDEKMDIIVNIKLDTYATQNEVKSTAELIYGEIGNDGYSLYTNKITNEKTFNLEIAEEKDIKDYVSINQTANRENKSTVNNGDEIVYTVEIKNLSKEDIVIDITDALPTGIKPTEIELDGKEITRTALDNTNTIDLSDYVLNGGKESTLKITSNYSREESTDEEITNIVGVEVLDNTTYSNAITYYAKTTESYSDGQDNNQTDNNNDNNYIEQNTNAQAINSLETENTTYTISGIAWLDTNKNGQRDSNEELLQGIEVKALDLESGQFAQRNGQDLSAITGENGNYSIELSRGNYVVVFMYNSDKYALTQYQKAGVLDDKNSDVISKEIEVNGNNVEVAATDTIKLISENVTNIDMGLLQNTKFDLELKNYVSEVTVKTSKGVNTYNYDNAELAKVEIHAKELENANVVIKYTMRVTNNGEIAGYVKDITDYMPTSLTFNSELNTNWYQSDKNLHNTSLMNTKIDAGETKDVTLILTKTMTESNTGLISNLAELTDVSNELGTEDLDSTPGNKTQGEDDLGKADVIISVKTGALITYVGLVIAILAIIGVGAIMINKKVMKNTDNIEDKLNF